MSYPVMALLVVASAVAIALGVGLVRGRRAAAASPGANADPRVHRGAALATAGLLVVLTVVVDSVMIHVGLFDYPPDALAGVRLGLAPLEDLSYPLAAAVLLPALWVALGGHDGAHDRGHDTVPDDGPAGSEPRRGEP